MEIGPTWFLYNNTVAVESGGWINIANSSHGLWLLSFWGSASVQACKVVSIVALRTAREDINASYNISLEIGTSRYRSGTFRFKVVDSLLLVDTPQEYWIDRDRQLLYYLPSAEGTLPRMMLSVAPTLSTSSDGNGHALVMLRPTNASAAPPEHINVRNITMTASTQGLMIADGVRSVEISGCDFQGAGETCLYLNGSSSTIFDSRMKYCGSSGLVMRGGNWNIFGPTLWLRANNLATGNIVQHFGRWHREAPGVSWSGVGHTMRNNIIRDGPGAAVMNEGSVDCLFEGNTVMNTTFEQEDRGAYCELTTTVAHKVN